MRSFLSRKSLHLTTQIKLVIIIFKQEYHAVERYL